MIAGVVGAGTMGLGIAHAFAVAGIPVTACEPDPAGRERAAARFADVLADGVRRGKLSGADADAAAARLTLVGSVAELPAGADVVVESAPEKLDVKHRVLAEIEARQPRILGTNTSSLSIDTLAGGLDRPERLLGFHFFNPVWAKPLVEIVVGAATDERTLHGAYGIARAIGKDAITVKDSPGFATSRLGVLLGLDVRLDIARYLATVYGDRFAPPQLLVELVAQGRLGRKTGRGFFEW